MESWGFALEELETQARIRPRGRAGLRFQKRMSGRISDLNKKAPNSN